MNISAKCEILIDGNVVYPAISLECIGTLVTGILVGLGCEYDSSFLSGPTTRMLPDNSLAVVQVLEGGELADTGVSIRPVLMSY